MSLFYPTQERADLKQRDYTLRYTTRRLHSSSSGNADHIGRVRAQSLAVC